MDLEIQVSGLAASSNGSSDDSICRGCSEEMKPQAITLHLKELALMLLRSVLPKSIQRTGFIALKFALSDARIQSS